MSEGQIHLSIARTRAGLSATPPRSAPSTPEARSVDATAVRAALSEVMDPELPMVSIADLGMVGDIEVGSGAPDDPAAPIRVELLPTFVGCPALEVIRDAVKARLDPFGRAVAVEVTFSPPWTTDRITAEGRRALTAAGIAEPAAAADVRCPYCRSERVVMDSAFGPTQCRSLYYCRNCRQPFEAMKLV